MDGGTVSTNRRTIATILAAALLLAAFLHWGAWTQIAFGLAALIVLFVPASLANPRQRSLR